MARIYIARSTGIGSFERHVVLKMILPERANDHTSVQMFLDEARLAASLNHQNVAQVFEVGQDAGVHFLAMEYVHGQDLRALLAKAGSTGTRVPLELALTVVAGAAAGLNHAHERRTSDGTPMGIVHRDVSPSNIMIGYDGSVKLLDFGIAKATMRSVETQSGIIKGKFAYMAPEQCRGRDVDRRSDVFSLGIILYEVTTQHRCFRADSDFDTMHRIVTGDIVRPTRLVQGYPLPLEAIVMKALAVDAAQRYQSAGALLEAVEAFAVSARMSLSTMSLGRFMRDMFGDVQEPWLASGRISQPPAAKEHTISNTNGSGDRSERAPSVPPVRHEDAPLHLPPSSLLDIPSLVRPDAPDEARAKIYPPPPGYGAPPEGRPSSSNLSSAHSAHSAHPAERASSSQSERVSSAQPSDRASSASLAPQLPARLSQRPASLVRPSGMANGSQPIPPHMAPPQSFPQFPPQPFPQQFSPQPGSGSGPAHGALPADAQALARTRQSYANAQGASQSHSNVSHSNISYPRYEPPIGSNPSIVGLPPSNRLLYIGLGVALVGIIVLLAISIADGSDDLPPPPPRPSTPFSSISETSPPAPAAIAPAAPPAPVKPEAFHAEAAATLDAAVVRDESITIRVVSTPPEADVLLAGKPIGITPLDTKIRRGTGSAMLTVHRARFLDVTTPIDLSTDFRKEVTLVLAPEEVEARPSNVRAPKPAPPAPREPPHAEKAPPRDTRPHPPTPAATRCQPPGQFNPFDTTCNGEPCKPCK